MKIAKYFVGLALLMPLALGAGNLDKVNAISKEIKSQYAPDSRQAIWEVSAESDGSSIVLKGKTSEAAAHASFVDALNKKKISYKDSIAVYPANKWGIVRISVAHLRGKPAHSAEIVSQAIMGTPLRLLEKEGEWWRVQSPDGYISYMIGNSFVQKTAGDINAWKKADRLVVSSLDQIKVYTDADKKGYKDIVTDLVNGCIVVCEKTQDEMVQVVLPDGRKAWGDASAFVKIGEWADQEFAPEKIIETGYSMMGIPYLWGGMSTKSLDCSGFARVCYFANGYILMRDASQQALTGKRIEAADWKQCQTGDLLFFGNAKTRRVTHVAIYEHDGWYLHSSGRVKRNSVDPKSEGYLTTPFLHAVRIAGNEGSKGITKVINHPWYF
ncbi:MAG: C40 family peptidase [Muribaculaceae bacterium]|nr:C40 family peptidase [Muribaculaceae bacterium]